MNRTGTGTTLPREWNMFSSQEPVALGAFPFRRIVQAPEREWRKAVVDQLNALVALDRGWDGYGAGPVKFENANFALMVLETACGSDSPVPQIVPGADGDLQIEWHFGNADIELHVTAPYRVSGFCAIDGQDPTEVQFTRDFTQVAEWVAMIAEPAGDAAAAA